MRSQRALELLGKESAVPYYGDIMPGVGGYGKQYEDSMAAKSAPLPFGVPRKFLTAGMGSYLNGGLGRGKEKIELAAPEPLKDMFATGTDQLD